MWKRVSDAVAALVFPSVCEICEATSAPEGVCRACAASLHRLSPPFCAGCGRTHAEACPDCSREPAKPFERAYACVVYDDKAKRLVRRFKYDGRRSLAGFLGGEMTGFARKHLGGTRFDAVVPVPLDASVRLERGYNQAELLAVRIGAALGVPMKNSLERFRSGAAQSGLARAARLVNVRGRFRARRPVDAAGRTLLLVDDVLTTGQTAAECAKALSAAGARSVHVLAFARGA